MKLNIYQLKHTAAVNLLNSEFSMNDIKGQFRHSSTNMTEIYASKFEVHLKPELKDKFPDL